MKRRNKILLGVLAVPVTALVAAAAAFVVLDGKKYDAPYPDIHASTDPAVIERGRYLAYGAAHCIDCHGENGDKNGPLSGGQPWKLPFGTLYSPNITPDMETGIGKRTDAELARTLRHGVAPDGRAVLPFMPFANMSDEDLTAIISFVRAQKPVSHAVPKHQVNTLGRVVLAFAIRPNGPDGTPPATVPRAVTAEYGSYLVNSVGNCAGCHTEHNGIGKPVGPRLAGGAEFEGYVTPNLTPDPATGRITNWTEDTFVTRFHVGAGMKGSPMPWKAFANMTDDDLRAIYRYLHTLPPVNNPKAPKEPAAQVALQ